MILVVTDGWTKPIALPIAHARGVIKFPDTSGTRIAPYPLAPLFSTLKGSDEARTRTHDLDHVKSSSPPEHAHCDSVKQLAIIAMGKGTSKITHWQVLCVKLS